MDCSVTRILALDLGKFKTVLCAMEVATREHHFEPLTTTPATIEDLLIRHRTSDPTHTLVVIETCRVPHLCTRKSGARPYVSGAFESGTSSKQISGPMPSVNPS